MGCVSVIGAGSWGTAVSRQLAVNGHTVRLWSHNPQVAQQINEQHTNPRYLPGCELPNEVTASTDLSWCLSSSEAAAFVVPSAHLREVAHSSSPYLSPDVPVAVLTKGIEPSTCMLMTEVVSDELKSPNPIACLSGPNHAEEVSRDLPSAAVTKGIEPSTCMLMTEVVSDELKSPNPIACLSGPNHAEEVSRDLPSAAVIAAESAECAMQLQRLFHSDTFRTYVSTDVVGVEVCAAAKNVVAIACGIARGLGECAMQLQRLFHSDTFRTYVSTDVVGVEVCAAAKNVVAIACGIARGLGMGDNTCALLMTRGLAEMSRLVAARGGNPITCMGLAGMGDLVATCTSAHSRNQTFGAAFASGETLAQFESRTHMVVEGARACRSVRELAQSYGVEVPIADAVFGLLYGEVSLEQITADLYARTPMAEFYGLSGFVPEA